MDTKAGVLIAALLLMTFIARANPVMFEPQSLIAFGIVAFWALVIESAIVTLSLLNRGILVVRSFITLIVANAVVFVFAFLPLSSHVSLWILEPGVVLADALVIKLLMAGDLLQGSGFLGVSWRRALLASFLGNSTSFFIGLIGSRTPWFSHGTVAVD
jgi:hypothetical protein